MKQVTITLKIKFHNLNQAKSGLFSEMTAETTSLANELLKLDIAERRKLTTAKVVTPLMSALSNQVIRQVKGKAGKKTKQFKVLPPEVNNQNWQVFKVGDTYSVSFPTLKGTKRVPLTLQDGHWRPILDKLVASDSSVQAGSLKLIKHRGKWYAFISVTQEVPEVQSTAKRVGIDRGQNNLAVAAPHRGFGRFFSGQEVKHKRRHFQQRRKSLQAAGKYRAVKKSEKKEAKWMDAVNHTVSRHIVDFADYLDADVVLEDLTGCRQTMKQSRKSRSDNGQSRHAWAFYDLEQKVIYKMDLLGRTAHKRPAAYTSKTSSIDGQLGLRDGHWFHAPTGEKLNSDLNACWNLSQWDGFSCSLDLQRVQVVIACADSGSGVFDNPRSSNIVSQPETGSCNSMNTVRGRVDWVQLSLFDTTLALG